MKTQMNSRWKILTYTLEGSTWVYTVNGMPKTKTRTKSKSKSTNIMSRTIMWSKIVISNHQNRSSSQSKKVTQMNLPWLISMNILNCKINQAILMSLHHLQVESRINLLDSYSITSLLVNGTQQRGKSMKVLKRWSIFSQSSLMTMLKLWRLSTSKVSNSNHTRNNGSMNAFLLILQ